MLDKDALGPSCRAGRINQISEVTRRYCTGWIQIAFPRRLFVPVVHTNYLRAMPREALDQRLLSQHDRHASIRQQVLKPVAWLLRIKRYVRGAGFENSKSPDYDLQRAFCIKTYQHVRSNSDCSQMVRELIGSTVQLPVSQRALFEVYCRFLRRSFNLG